MRRKANIRSAVIAALVLATPGTAVATPLAFSYQGRLVDDYGAPRPGTVSLEVSFFRSATGGSPLLAPRTLENLELKDGIFTLDLDFVAADYHALFADDSEVWIQLKDLDQNLSLPRQRLNAAPFANKIPVDGATLVFDSDGKLAVNQISSAQVSGLSAALSGKADSSALTTKADAATTTTALAAKADAAATTTALASKADAAATTSALAGKADAAHSHTLAGDVAGDLASTTVTKLQGVPIDTTAPNTVGQVLKWDGSQWAPGPDDGGVAGAISNGSNLGGGNNLFKAVNGSALEFRTVTGSGNISATTAGDNVQITTTPGITATAQAGFVAAPYGTGAGNTGELRFQELAAGGGNYVAFKAPDAMAADTTYTLPTAAPASNGQVLSGSTAGALSWTTLPSALPPSGAAGGSLSGSYPNPSIAAGAVTATELAADAVTSAKIATDTITAADIAADAVGSSEIAADAVTSSELAADSVTASELADGAVTTSKLAAGAVTSTELATDAVTNGKIAADAINSAKILDGSIADADVDAAAAIARSKLAAGTNNHVLINNGSGVMSSEAQLATSRGGTGVNSSATFPTSGVIVTETATETLTNKTLTSPTLNTPTINGGTIGAALGAVGTPSYSFTGDADTGTWSSGANTFNVSTGGGERLRIDASGNVGIGTTSPLHALDVYGNAPTSAIRTPGVAGSDQVSLGMITKDDGSLLGTANNRGWSLYGRGNAYATTSSQNDLGFGYWNGSVWTTYFSMKPSSGYVGIKTSSPESLLQLGTSHNFGTNGSNLNSSFNAYYDSVAAAWEFTGWGTSYASQTYFNPTIGLLQLRTSSSSGAAGAPITWNSGFSMDANGNVGIGTTAPSSVLHVVSGGQGIQFGSGSNSSGYTLSVGVNDNGVNLSNNSSVRGFNFANGSGTLMTIGSNGNVGIGTTTPAEMLHVGGKVRAAEFCIGTDCKSAWAAAIGGYAFGSATSKTADTVYTATTDGLVTAYVYASTNPSRCSLTGKTDSNTTPTTVVARDVASYTATWDSSYYANVTFPVKSGDKYWVQFIDDQGTCSGKTVLWTSIVNSGGGSSAAYASSSNPPVSSVYVNNSGNVGIGTTSPGTKLEVAGGIKPGNVTTGTSCAGNTEGSFGYDSATHAPVYCSNSGNWTAIGTAGGVTANTTASCAFNNNTCIATCPAGYYRSGCSTNDTGSYFAVRVVPSGANGCNGGDITASGLVGTVYAYCVK